MTLGSLMSQKNTPLPLLNVLGNIVAAIGLKRVSTRFCTQKEYFAPFVWAFKC
jgi:hypothetical protein